MLMSWIRRPESALYSLLYVGIPGCGNGFYCGKSEYRRPLPHRNVWGAKLDPLVHGRGCRPTEAYHREAALMGTDTLIALLALVVSIIQLAGRNGKL
ncbi:hypothetical protein ACLBWT_22460 [Paenibacillus sp. D51F]